MCPFEGPCSRKIKNTTPHMAGFNCLRGAFLHSKLDWTEADSKCPVQYQPNSPEHLKSPWNWNLTQASTTYHNGKWASKDIPTTRTRSKLDLKWLAPFSIRQQIPTSENKLKLLLSMKGVHLVFNTSFICTRKPYLSRTTTSITWACWDSCWGQVGNWWHPPLPKVTRTLQIPCQLEGIWIWA